VVTQSAEAAARHRYSIAFFVNPDREVVIAAHPRTVGGAAAGGAAPKYPPISSKQFVEMKLREMSYQ
jgi:isopenicillin N synthase-like dioxygenase